MTTKIPHALPSNRSAWNEKQFARGISLFNSGKFFEAHEAWEEIWLLAAGREKQFLQGLIQCAAAFHHHSHGNRAGTQSLLRTGLGKLEKLPANFGGIALEEFRADVRGCIGESDHVRGERKRTQPPQILKAAGGK